MNENKKKSNDTFFTVLVVQSIVAFVLIGVLIYSFFGSGSFYKMMSDGYNELMSEEIESEDIAQAFMKINEYADVFAPKNETTAEETASQNLSAGGKDLIFSSLDTLEGVCFDKVETQVEMEIPLEIYEVTSLFGYRTGPITGEPGIHTGIDLAADYGTPIKAAADGEVVDASWDNSYGNYVKILHDNNTVTIYAHCSSLCVDEGDYVESGDVIAKVGSTGDSTGNHLHFEIRKDNIRIDPSFYIDV